MNKLLQEFYCNYCDKNYKSYQSLWNHKRKFHSKITQNNSISPQNNSIFKCDICDKSYTRIDNLTRHKKSCIVKKDNMLKKENEELRKQLEVKEQLMEELREQIKQLLNANCKIHPKTLQKINNNINTQNNIQNQQNNINIIGFDKMELDKIFSKKEQLKILKQKYNCLPHLIKYAHFNDNYPQLKNIKITNLKDKNAYKYDEETQKFIATTKDQLITDLVNDRMLDIDEFQTGLYERLKPREKEIIDDVLKKYYNDDNFIDSRKEDIKFLIYNYSDNNIN